MISVGIQIELFSIEIGPMCRPPVAAPRRARRPAAAPGTPRGRPARGDDGVGDAAEVARRACRTIDGQERREERGEDADEERVAGAVEQAHHDVAAVAVGAEEVLAVPRRAGRHAVEGDHLDLLAADVQRVGDALGFGVVLATWSAYTGASSATSDEQEEQHAERQRGAVVPEPAPGEVPRAEPVGASGLTGAELLEGGLCVG